nr:hypothetical protein [Anaerolineae bacterium]
MSEPRRLRARPGILRWLPFALIGAALLPLLRALLGGETLFWGLPTLQFYPWREFAFAELRAGRLPAWNPYLGAGAPLLANYQTAIFYPPNWLMLVLPGPLAMSLLALAHVLWAALGTWRLGGALGMTPFGRGISALSYALGGYLIARLGSFPTHNAAAWLPWVFWLAHRVLTRRTWRDAGALALAVGLLLLAGHAQTAWYGLLGAGAYALWRALWADRRASRRARARGLALAGLGVALGAGIAAVQLIPTAEYLRQSDRAGGLDYAALTNLSYHPARLLTLLMPHFFGTPADGSVFTEGIFFEDAAYLGVIPLIAAGAAVTAWLFRRKALPPGPLPGRTREGEVAGRGGEDLGGEASGERKAPPPDPLPGGAREGESAVPAIQVPLSSSAGEGDLGGEACTGGDQTSEVFEDFGSLVRRKAPPPGPLPGGAREGEVAGRGGEVPLSSSAGEGDLGGEACTGGDQTSEVFEDFGSLVRRQAPPPGPLPGGAREGEVGGRGGEVPLSSLAGEGDLGGEACTGGDQTSEVFEDFGSLVRRKAPPPGPLPGGAREGEVAGRGGEDLGGEASGDHDPALASVPFWAALALAGLFLAAGKYNPAFRPLYDHVPTFGAFREPVRWLILTHLGLALLAGIGVDRWGHGPRVVYWSRLTAAGGVGMALLALGARTLADLTPPELNTMALAVAAFGGWIAVAALLTLAQPLDPAESVRSILWRAAVLLVVTLDLTWFAAGLNPTVPAAFFDRREVAGPPGRVYWFDDAQYDATFGTDEDEAPPVEGFFDVGDYRIAVRRREELRASLLPNLNLLDRVPSLDNNDPLLPDVHRRYVALVEELGAGAGALLRAAGVTRAFGVAPDGWTGTTPAVAPDADGATAWLVGAAEWRESDEAISAALRDPAWD